MSNLPLHRWQDIYLYSSPLHPPRIPFRTRHHVRIRIRIRAPCPLHRHDPRRSPSQSLLFALVAQREAVLERRRQRRARGGAPAHEAEAEADARGAGEVGVCSGGLLVVFYGRVKGKRRGERYFHMGGFGLRGGRGRF